MRINIAEVTKKQTSEKKDMLAIVAEDGKRYGCFLPALFKALQEGGTVEVEVVQSGNYTNIIGATKIGQAHPVNRPDGEGMGKELFGTGAVSATPPVAFAELPDKVTALGARLDGMAKVFTGITEEIVKLRQAVFARSQADPEKDRRITRLSLISSVAGLYQGRMNLQDPPEELAKIVSQIIAQVAHLEAVVYGTEPKAK